MQCNAGCCDLACLVASGARSFVLYSYTTGTIVRQVHLSLFTEDYLAKLEEQNPESWPIYLYHEATVVPVASPLLGVRLTNQSLLSFEAELVQSSRSSFLVDGFQPVPQLEEWCVVFF